ncbi:hypothetical protein HanPI659440_Chr11g0434751 [Helianthus annuus]|nr:hypothetical protein HanPI659440_Chr11g0434751 [Helianthus annuus]
MFSFWFVFVYLMTDMFPVGHGETELGIHHIRILFREGHTRPIVTVSPRRVGGKAKNQKLCKMVKAGGPVSLTFDRDVTYTPVVVPSDLFPREGGMYIWRTTPFDKMGWDKVSKPHKDAIMNHLKVNKLFRLKRLQTQQQTGVKTQPFAAAFAVVNAPLNGCIRSNN